MTTTKKPGSTNLPRPTRQQDKPLSATVIPFYLVPLHFLDLEPVQRGRQLLGGHRNHPVALQQHNKNNILYIYGQDPENQRKTDQMQKEADLKLC